MSPSVLSVRVSEEERSLLKAAAEHSCMSLSDFVRRKALEAAAIDLLERGTGIQQWEAFGVWARRPAQEVLALKKLFRVAPKWQE